MTAQSYTRIKRAQLQLVTDTGCYGVATKLQTCRHYWHRVILADWGCCCGRRSAVQCWGRWPPLQEEQASTAAACHRYKLL